MHNGNGHLATERVQRQIHFSSVCVSSNNAHPWKLPYDRPDADPPIEFDVAKVGRGCGPTRADPNHLCQRASPHTTSRGAHRATCGVSQHEPKGVWVCKSLRCFPLLRQQPLKRTYRRSLMQRTSQDEAGDEYYPVDNMKRGSDDASGDRSASSQPATEAANSSHWDVEEGALPTNYVHLM